jgi:hypothetical protein
LELPVLAIFPTSEDTFRSEDLICNTDLRGFHGRLSFLLGLDDSQGKDHAASYEECSNFHTQKYNLRKGVRKNRQAFATLIDQDDSGTYDLNEPNLLSVQKRRRVARQHPGTSNPQQQIEENTTNVLEKDQTPSPAVQETAPNPVDEPIPTESPIRVPHFATKPRHHDGRKAVQRQYSPAMLIPLFSTTKQPPARPNATGVSRWDMELRASDDAESL